MTMPGSVPFYFDGPEPPEGRIWCAVCAMQYKNGGVKHFARQIDAHEKLTGTNGALVRSPRFDLTAQPGKQELAVAVTKGISILGPNFGQLDLCWSHVMGLDLRNGLMPATPQEASMFSQARMLG